MAAAYLQKGLAIRENDYTQSFLETVHYPPIAPILTGSDRTVVLEFAESVENPEIVQVLFYAWLSPKAPHQPGWAREGLAKG